MYSKEENVTAWISHSDDLTKTDGGVRDRRQDRQDCKLLACSIFKMLLIFCALHSGGAGAAGSGCVKLKNGSNCAMQLSNALHELAGRSPELAGRLPGL